MIIEAERVATHGVGGSEVTDATQVDPRSFLRTTTFRRLTVSWWGTNIADSVLVLLLAVWVADLTGSAAAGGVTLAVLGVPALFSPLLGQLADRVSRKAMLTVAYLAGAAVLVPLLFVTTSSHVWIVYAVTVTYSTVNYATGAAQSGLLRDLLPDEALGRANARFSMIDQVCRIVLPIAGAAVYAVTGIVPLVLLAIGGFSVAAVFLATLDVTESERTSDDTTPRLGQLTAGFRHLWSVQPLAGMTNAIAVAMAITGLINGISFAILAAFGLDNAWLGPIVVMQGVAGVAAGALSPRIMQRLGRVGATTCGLSLVTVGLLPLLGPSIWPVIAGMAFVGFGIVVTIVAWTTERQIATPADLQGRVATAGQMVMNLPQAVFALAAAALVTTIDVRWIVGVTVLGCALAVIMSARLRWSRRAGSVTGGDSPYRR